MSSVVVMALVYSKNHKIVIWLSVDSAIHKLNTITSHENFPYYMYIHLLLDLSNVHPTFVKLDILDLADNSPEFFCRAPDICLSIVVTVYSTIGQVHRF